MGGERYRRMHIQGDVSLSQQILPEDDYIHLIETFMGGGEILKRTKKFLSLVVAALLMVVTFLSYLPAQTASAKPAVPEIKFASPPVTQYNAGDRVNFNIYAPNYGGKVQYRVVLWNDSKKTYYDLWNESNGYPTRYYTKWQPYGNNIFTLGWIIFEPGSYRITVYAKRAGIANSKTALKAYNCDSFMESAAFYVKSKEATVNSILPVNDVTVMQGATPSLPTKVKASMSDGVIKELGVTWGSVSTSNPGAYTIEGTVAGTTLKAYVKVNVTAQTAMDVSSVVSVGNYLVNVTLKDAIYTTPDASKFSIKTYNSSTTIPVQSVTLSSDKKTVVLNTGYMTTNSWYTLTVNNNNYNFIANQGTGSGISLSAQNKEVAVNGTVYATVTAYPSDVILTYYSSNTSYATVNQSTGLITGKNPGIATITVYGNKSGYSQASTTFTVNVGGQSGMYAYASNMEIGVGARQMPSITKYPNDLTLTFTTSNSSIASVDYYTGQVTGVSQGTTTITIAASKYGYSTVYSTFTVTVRGQGMAISATPIRIYESMANDGSLESGVIDITLTGSTFYNWGYYYYENYVDIFNLPYGMNYTVAYVNSNKLRVTITGKAYSHRNADDATIYITVGKDIVYGASYDLISNNIVLDFTDYPTPAAPTNPVVDDTNNTFGWTIVPGYPNITDYEYRLKEKGSTWSNWTVCTKKPLEVGDKDYEIGGVEVRVGAVSGRNAGYVLASNAVFTKAPINDNTPPVLSNLTITFKGKDIGSVYSPNSKGEYSVDISKGTEITGMKMKVDDANINTAPVKVYYASTQNEWGTLKYSSGEWTLDMATCAKKKFDEVTAIALEASFKDTKNTTKAAIFIKVTETLEKPAAPTEPVIDDVKNTFGWTNTPGYDKVTDYEYSVDSGANWVDCTANPQQLLDENYAVEAVQVRVKASTSPVRLAGHSLKSNKPYTKGTIIDDKAPELVDIVMTFKDYETKTSNFVDGKALVNIPYGTVLNSMMVQVKDANLDTSNVTVYQLNSLGDVEKEWGKLKYNSNTSLWELVVTNPSQYTFNAEKVIKLSMLFKDTNNLYSTAKVDINVFLPISKIENIEKTLNQYSPFEMPKKVTAIMKDGKPRDVDVSWDKNLTTAEYGKFEALGTVIGYDTKVIYTLTVNRVLIKVTRTSNDIKLARDGTGGTKLNYTFANQKLNITGTDVPWYPKGVKDNPPYAGNWIGVGLDRPAGASDVDYFYYKGVKYNWDYTTGFDFYFEISKAPITVEIQWGEKYIETLTIQCTATGFPAP